VRSSAELDARLGASGKPVMLAFSAQWCVACKEMDHTTFLDARVQKRLGEFELLEADVTDNTIDDQALLKRFGLYGPPAFLFFDSAGQPIPAATVIGYEGARTFLNDLMRIVS
jgi:thiol:disulfide interchange protein DsbD